MNLGITGHQNLGNSSDIVWIRDILCKEIKNLVITRGYSCLAKGADQLFAEIILENNIDLVVLIPSQHYEETFKDSIDMSSFRRLKNKATTIIQLNNKEPNSFAFFDASKILVDNCEVLLAVWNGKPAEGFGGTADVVYYARLLKKPIIQVNPISKEVIYIN